MRSFQNQQLMICVGGMLHYVILCFYVWIKQCQYKKPNNHNGILVSMPYSMLSAAEIRFRIQYFKQGGACEYHIQFGKVIIDVLQLL